MYQIIKCYKQGRAVMFYDLRDTDGTVKEKVHKDDVVKLIEGNQVSNTKVQWWEGKPIVRMGDKNIPIVKLGDDGSCLGNVAAVTRNSSKNIKDNTPDISSKAVVVGKLNKNKKDSVAYGGYAIQHKVNAQEMKNSIDYKQFKTIKDLFIAVAKEYNLKNIELYLAQFSKKVNINKEINQNTMAEVIGIQYGMNIYLMNMANKEINDTFTKYNVV